jgi:hypothetical protein
VAAPVLSHGVPDGRKAIANIQWWSPDVGHATNTSPPLSRRIEPMELDRCLRRGELPAHRDLRLVALRLPTRAKSKGSGIYVGLSVRAAAVRPARAQTPG